MKRLKGITAAIIYVSEEDWAEFSHNYDLFLPLINWYQGY